MKFNEHPPNSQKTRSASVCTFFTPTNLSVCEVSLGLNQGLIHRQLTSLGPVLASFHSAAVVLMRSRGSSHETPKYIEMDTVCNEIDRRIELYWQKM